MLRKWLGDRSMKASCWNSIHKNISVLAESAEDDVLDGHNGKKASSLVAQPLLGDLAGEHRKNGLKEAGLSELVDRLENGELAADTGIYVILLRRCAYARDLTEGKRVHAHILRSGYLPDVFVRNLVVEMYGKCGDLQEARVVFDGMEERNLRNSYSWNTMVAAYAQNGHPVEALELFQEMDLEGGKPDKYSFANILSACSSLGALAEGKAIHADVVANGLEGNVVIGTALVNLYGKCGSLDDARATFEKMAARDVVCWSAMIALYAQQGHYREAITLYRQMLLEGVMPEEVTFVSLVAACTTAGATRDAQQIHAFAAGNGFKVDAILGGSLVNMYGKVGNLEAAKGVHDGMQCRNVVSWTAIIAAYAQHGHGLDALRSYTQMDHEGIKPNEVTFINVLGACCSSSEFLEAGKAIHARVVASGLEVDGVLGTALVNMYGKCGSIEAARGTFHRMTVRDTVAWNAMLAAYAQLGHCKEVCELYWRMQLEGKKLDDVTFVSLLDACGELEDLSLGRQIHDCIAAIGLDEDEGVGSSLINMYGKCGCVADARQVFDRVGWRSLLAWNAMVAAYSQHGHGKEAMGLCRRLDLEGLKFDEATFVSALCACSCLGALPEGRAVHERLCASGIKCNVTVWNALVNMYGKCGCPEDARAVFETVSSRDVVTWNAMFAAYAQQGHGKPALKLLQFMDLEGVKGDEITLVSILDACASSAALADSRKLHARAAACGLEAGDAVGGLLVNAYGKSGSLEQARRMFDRMGCNKKLFAWTALVASYAQHGHGKEAVEVSQKMDLEGLKPSDITFITILFACSHAGLLQEGRHYFLSMSGDHGLPASEDHYKCLIDLLGRAGQLGLAEDLVNEMPFEPDYVSWMTLLGACKVHSDAERGARAARNAFRLDTKNPTPFIVLSNIYAGAGGGKHLPEVEKTLKDLMLE